MPNIPETMTAVAITTPGGPEVLKAQSMPTPKPGAGQILVEGGGGGREPARRGAAHGRLSASARSLAAARTGDRGGSRGDRRRREALEGGRQALCACEWRRLCGIRDRGGDGGASDPVAGSTWSRPAAVPETFFTVWNNVFERGGLKAGEWFLVHGGSSGIGTTAIQLAKAFGAKVLATAGTADKCKACAELGADRAINYKTEDFVAASKEATGGKGINVILDMVGGDYTDRNIIAAADDGRIVQIATLGGADVKINIGRLMIKRVTLTGSTLRPRTRDVKANFARALEEKVWPLFAQGRLQVVMDFTFPLAQAADAHRRLETSAHVGKIVLTI